MICVDEFGPVDNGCCNGAVAPFLTGLERFAGLWQDLNPNIGGTVHVDIDPVLQEVYVTWLAVPEYANAGNLNTCQIMMNSAGLVEYRWQQCANVTHQVLVGWTPGANARDPGNRDLSTAVPFNTRRDSNGLSLVASARPLINSTFNLITGNIPANTAVGAAILSFTQHDPGLDATPYGMPGCFQYVGLDVSFVFVTGGNPTANQPITLPNMAGLLGLHFWCQSATFSPGQNALGVVSSNGIDLGIGNL